MKSIRTRYSTIMNTLSLLFLIGTLLYLIMSWNSIPEQIPTHYNAAGEADSWGRKATLLIFPIISWIVIGFISLVECFPEAWNTDVEVTPQNKEQVYRLLKHILVTLKFEICVYFFWLTFLSSKSDNLGLWNVIIFLMTVFGTLGWYLYRLYHIKL